MRKEIVKASQGPFCLLAASWILAIALALSACQAINAVTEPLEQGVNSRALWTACNAFADTSDRLLARADEIRAVEGQSGVVIDAANESREACDHLDRKAEPITVDELRTAVATVEENNDKLLAIEESL